MYTQEYENNLKVMASKNYNRKVLLWHVLKNCSWRYNHKCLRTKQAPFPLGNVKSSFYDIVYFWTNSTVLVVID